MARFRSSNPMFKIAQDQTYQDSAAASYTGISLKTTIMLVIAVITGIFSHTLLMNQNEGLYTILSVSAVVGFISVIVASFSVRLAAPFSILYAACEGIVLGVLTTIVNLVVPNAGTIAGISTMVIFAIMFFLYSSRIIRVTGTFRRVVMGILLSIVLISLIQLIFFPSFYQSADLGLLIGISIFLVIFGAIMLAMDFNQAESVVQNGLDKRYEWRIALGLMITIVWIYVELLRLIILLNSKRD